MGLATGAPVVVEVLRARPSSHATWAHFAVVHAAGALHMAWGDVDRPVFPRSAVKLLQAPAAGDERRGRCLCPLSDAELALACASHSGEPAHVATAQGWLARLGLTAEHLECRHAVARASCRCCGPWQRGRGGRAAAQQLLGQALRLSVPGLPSLPSVGRCRPCWFRTRLCGARAPGDARGHARAGADHRAGPGPCATRHRWLFHPPTYALPLRALALAFARVGIGQRLSRPMRPPPPRWLRRAVAKAPFMVAAPIASTPR